MWLQMSAVDDEDISNKITAYIAEDMKSIDIRSSIVYD